MYVEYKIGNFFENKDARYRALKEIEELMQIEVLCNKVNQQ